MYTSRLIVSARGTFHMGFVRHASDSLAEKLVKLPEDVRGLSIQKVEELKQQLKLLFSVRTIALDPEFAIEGLTHSHQVTRLGGQRQG